MFHPIENCSEAEENIDFESEELTYEQNFYAASASPAMVSLYYYSQTARLACQSGLT